MQRGRSDSVLSCATSRGVTTSTCEWRTTNVFWACLCSWHYLHHCLTVCKDEELSARVGGNVKHTQRVRPLFIFISPLKILTLFLCYNMFVCLLGLQVCGFNSHKYKQTLLHVYKSSFKVMMPTLITAQCCESSLPSCCHYCEPFQRHVDPMEIRESPFDPSMCGAPGAPTCSLVWLTEKVPRRTRKTTFLLWSLFTLSVLLQPEFSTRPMMWDLLWSVPLTWSTWIKYRELKEHDPDFPLLQRRDALVPFLFQKYFMFFKTTYQT